MSESKSSAFWHKLMLWIAGSCVFCSAWMMIYIKDYNRRLMLRAQAWEQLNQKEKTYGQQLLLKCGILRSSSRIHHLAETHLHMVFPSGTQVQWIHIPIHK